MLVLLLAAVVSVASSAPASPADPAASGAAPSAPAEQRSWEATLDRATKAIVALRVTGTRDFDTESAGSSVGTGFVVDAERGIILTNRHMVHAGPVVAEAVFLDHEEVELKALYRDPVHDFGFYQFDPGALRFMELVALPLAPENARVGMEIRVVGNDAGEKISILDGTLARLDRSAPSYGGNTYNDFNTFYYQAASGTSGGSSGSPVLDLLGNAVALNAGGSREAASSFYLPLDRVVRALALIREGAPVPRGTLQTVFQYRPYDEVRRLGLTDASEAAVREAFPQATGLLVVDETVPEGPGHERLETGDILLAVDGRATNAFVPLEASLDDGVGRELTLDVERGGRPVSVKLTVGDLHAISPDEYLEVGRAVLHPLSYQQARNHALPVRGVYVAVAGYMLSRDGVPQGALVREIDGVPVPDLDALERELAARPHGARMQWRWSRVSDPFRETVSVVTMDRLWYPVQRCRRDDATGTWPCRPTAPAPGASPQAPASTDLFAEGSRAARRLAPSLVMIDFDIPYPTAGVKDVSYVGSGVVVDAERGLVLCDRDTVPVTLGDLVLTVGGTVRVPATLEYLHPVHNYALLRYDPALLGDTPVRAASLVDAHVEPDDRVWQVALTRGSELVDQKTEVERFDTVSLGASRTPRFRDANLQGIQLVKAQPSMGGVVANRRGEMIALWASFLDPSEGERRFYGLPVAYVAPLLERIGAGEPDPAYHWFGVEFAPLPLADARDRGLSDARAAEALRHDARGRKVLQISRLSAGTDAERLLREGDLLLEVNGRVATRAGEVEAALDPYARDTARLVVLRDGQEVEVDLRSMPLLGRGVDRVASWAGLVVHESHFEVATQRGSPDEGVYVAWLWYGSPAARYGLRPTRRIVEIDGRPTDDLDTFLAAVAGMGDRQAVRVKTVTLDGRPSVETLKLDLHYWPTAVYERQAGRWTSREIQ